MQINNHSFKSNILCLVIDYNEISASQKVRNYS